MKITPFAASLTLTTMFFAGCSSNYRDVGYASISKDLTPGLRSLTERPVDVDLNLAINKNANWRMLNDDIGRFFYTDHQSRLSPMPITYRNGLPR